MNTAQLYSGEVVLDLPVSSKDRTIEAKESIQYFGSEKDYKKIKKYLIWFSVSSLAIFISISTFVF